MRKSLVYTISLLFIVFVLSCASKNKESVASKETASKTEVAKKEVKAEETNAVETKPVEAIPAVQIGDLKVEDASIATNVDNLNPSGMANEFPKETPKLYCYSKVIGAEGETTIKHIWYYKDKLNTETELPVKSKSWRTYSYKTMGPEFAGNWKIDITTKDGKILKTLTFTIK